MLRLALAVATALAAAGPATAGEASRPSREQQLAVQLARLAMPEANWDQIVAQTRVQLRENMELGMQQAGELPPRLRAFLAQEMETFFDDLLYTYPEVLDLQAGLLVKHYTEAELDQLVDFYETPLGQKSIQVMPSVMQDAAAAGQARMMERLPAKLERLKERLSAEAERVKAEGASGPAEAPTGPASAR